MPTICPSATRIRAIGVLMTAVSAAHPTPLDAVTIIFDYTYDTIMFFDNSRREVLALAADMVGTFVDRLDAINPTDGNTWGFLLSRPDGGQELKIDLSVPENSIVVFVGARPLNGPLALAGIPIVEEQLLGGSDQWKQTVRTRGRQADISTPEMLLSPWGGTISFSTDVSWHSERSTVGLGPEKYDFLTVALHELVHLLGMGPAASWTSQIDAMGRFTGTNASLTSSPTNPELFVSPDGAHWQQGTTGYVGAVQQTSPLVPQLEPGARLLLTDVDRAMLSDLGWSLAAPGDATRDRVFNSSDLVAVFQAGKYETGEPAGWSEGDWNGDGQFTSSDLVAAFQTGSYETGSYAALPAGDPNDANAVILNYNEATGELSIVAGDVNLTTIEIISESGIFTGDPAQNLGGTFDVSTAEKIFKLDPNGFGSLSFGNVAATGLSLSFLQQDLKVDGSLAGGGGLPGVDIIPEPASLALLGLGGLALLRRRSA